MLREAPGYDLRDAVGPHRHAVEDIRGLHRPLLVRDDHELRPVRVATKELDEASDVRIVERGLDLVEKIEGARSGEEQREEERDRAERLLASGQEREARDALPCGPELHLDAGLSAFLVGLDEPEPSLATGEQGGCDLLEVLRHRGERLGEAPLDGRGELCAELLELDEALLEVLTLHLEIVESLLLGLVLLARERVDLTKRAAPHFEALDADGQLVAVVSFRRLDVTGGLEPSGSLGDVGVDTRDLDLGGRDGNTRLFQLAPEVHLCCPEGPKLLAELARPRRPCIGPGAKRRLESPGSPLSSVDAVPKGRREIDETSERCGIDRRRAEPRRLTERGLCDLRSLRRLLGGARRGRDILLERLRLGGERRATPLELEQDGFGRLTDEPQLAAHRVVAEPLGRDGRRRDLEERSRAGRPGTHRRCPAASARQAR